MVNGLYRKVRAGILWAQIIINRQKWKDCNMKTSLKHLSLSTVVMVLSVLGLAVGQSVHAQSFTATGTMVATGYDPTTTVLPNGLVLVAGGWNGGSQSS